MTPERWREIEAVFDQAIDLPVEERAQFVSQACGADRALRTEVELLLAAAPGAGQQLRSAVQSEAAHIAHAAIAAHVGRRIGPYRLLEPLGEGGMGVVYRAVRDDKEYEREVAIKILRHGLGSPQAIARFRDERQILATLDHPGIVRLLDGGSTDDHLPYLVMEHIEGAPITTHVRERRLAMRGRVELVLAICDAVQHAHHQLVIHRDLKPTNILVDSEGRPKLLDFGIAKLQDARTEREARTAVGTSPLTLAYASPEQVRGEQASMASDVYSLGAVMYEVFAERPPHVATGSGLELLRMVCEVDPPRPSAVAPVGRRRELIGDLDNIVLKALHRDVADRYRSIEQLADDLRRYLTGRPVAARAPTLRYRAGKWLVRNRLPASIAAVALVAVAIVGVTSIQRIQRARSELSDTVRHLYVEQARQLLFKNEPNRALAFLAAALEGGLDNLPVRYLTARASSIIDQQEHVLPHVGCVNAVAWSPDGTLVASGGEAGEAHLWDAATGHEVAALAGQTRAIRTLVFSPDGRVLAAGDYGGTIALHDTATGRVIGMLEGHRPVYITSTTVAALGGVAGVDTSGAGRGDEVWVYDTTRLVRIDRIPAYGGVWAAAGGRVAVATASGIRISGDSPCEVTLSEPPAHLAVRRDGAVVAAAAGATVKIIDVASCRVRSTLSEWGPVSAIEFGPLPELLFVTSARTRVWNIGTSTMMFGLGWHTGAVTSLAMVPGGDHFVSTGVDRSVVVWVMSSSSIEQILLVHGNAVTSSAFAPDGKRFITGSTDHTARIIRLAVPGLSATLRHHERVTASQFTAGGDIVTVTADGSFTRWRGGRAEPLAPRCTGADGELCQPSGDGEHLVRTVGTRAESLSLAGAAVAHVEHTGPIEVLGGIANTSWVTTASSDGEIKLWDAETGAVRRDIRVPDEVTAVAWTPDASRVATRSPKGVAVWDASGALIRRFPTRSHAQHVVAIDAAGRRVIGPNEEGDLAMWEIASGRLLSVIEAHQSEVKDAAFSPDGQFVATSSSECARIHDAATGEVLSYFDRELDHASTNAVAWRADGRQLVVSGVEKLARVWDVAPDRRSVAQIVEAAACRGGFVLDGSVPRAVDARDGCPKW